jgi:hypothetical protein
MESVLVSGRRISHSGCNASWEKRYPGEISGHKGKHSWSSILYQTGEKKIQLSSSRKNYKF